MRLLGVRWEGAARYNAAQQKFTRMSSHSCIFLSFPAFLSSFYLEKSLLPFQFCFCFFKYNKTSNVKNVSPGLGLQGKLFYCLMCKCGMQQPANPLLGTIPNISAREAVFMKVGWFSTVLKARSKIGFG